MSESSYVLPNNTEAEHAFLGIVINDAGVLASLTTFPYSHDFFLERNKIIAQSIYDMLDRGNHVDLISISENLKQQNVLEKVGGVGYLSALTDSGLSSHNVEFYASLIIEKSQRRNLIRHASTILSQSKDESIEINALIEESEKEILNITDREGSYNYRPVKDHMREFLETVQQRMKDHKQGQYFGIESKFVKLDDLLTGFHQGELIIIAARASIGKTAFTLNLINNISLDAQIPTAFFSLEMSGVDIVARIISMRTGIPGDRFRKNMISSADISNIMQKFGKKFNTPLYISDTPSMNLFDLRVQARRLVAKEGVKIIFIDYLGLIGYQGEGGANKKSVSYMPRFEKISEVSKSLKSLARELQIPIVVLAQLNRESEGKMPTLANIRDSGAIEQDADVVMLLHRNREETETKLIVAKHRNGPTGEVSLQFVPSAMSFREVASSDGPM